VLMWLMKTLLTSGCTNQRGAGQILILAEAEGGGVKSLTAKAKRTAASVNFLYPRKMKFNQE
ncbi:hypothetical protein, partial [Klebsiella pneumoniae]